MTSFLVLGLLAACSGPTPTAPAASSDAGASEILVVQPMSATLAVGEEMEVSARLQDAAGIVVPADLEWMASNAAVVSMEGAGDRRIVRAIAPGAAVVTIRRSASPSSSATMVRTVSVEVLSTDAPQTGGADPADSTGAPVSGPTDPDSSVDSSPASESAQEQDAGNRLFGVHQDLTYDGWDWRRAEGIDRARQLGARVSRNSFLWHQVEPEEGHRDWSRVDAVLSELESAGLEPLMVIVGSPPWASGVDPSVHDAKFYVPTDPARFEAWLAAYEDFIREAVMRYRGRVRLWELWNEQNQHFFWKPQPDIEQYIAWYQRISSAIRELDPEARIASGGLTGLCCGPAGTYTGREFLAGLLKRGLQLDAIAIHPYASASQPPDVTLQWENNFTDIGMIHELMTSHGMGDTPIWVTEWGWSTTEMSEAQQADFVARSLRMLKQDYPYVTVATYFVDVDKPPEYFEGLFAADGRIKEAGRRFREVLTGGG